MVAVIPEDPAKEHQAELGSSLEVACSLLTHRVQGKRTGGHGCCRQGHWVGSTGQHRDVLVVETVVLSRVEAQKEVRISDYRTYLAGGKGEDRKRRSVWDFLAVKSECSRGSVCREFDWLWSDEAANR